METRLKEARKETGFSQKDAADKLGVSLGTYRNWEQGRVIMNGEQLIRTAHLFGTDVDYLLMTDVDESGKEKMFRELEQIYDRMDDDGRETLLIIARGLVEKFQS